MTTPVFGEKQENIFPIWINKITLEFNGTDQSTGLFIIKDNEWVGVA